MDFHDKTAFNGRLTCPSHPNPFWPLDIAWTLDCYCSELFSAGPSLEIDILRSLFDRYLRL